MGTMRSPDVHKVERALGHEYWTFLRGLGFRGDERGCGAGCAAYVFAVLLVGLVVFLLLIAVLGGGSDAPESGGDEAAVAVAVSTPSVDGTDLAVIEGPWRIRNEELAVGGVLTPYTTVERGTFTVTPDGRLVATTEDGGDLALGFDLVGSSPTERVYTTTFMGAVYTLTFDEPGHFVGEIVFDGVLERRIEGWSELDENGAPRPDLPEVGESESTSGPATGPSSDGDAAGLGIAASCGVDWLPADLALPLTTFEPGVDRNGDPACIGTYVNDGFGSARSVLVVQSGLLGLEYFEESGALVILGCTGDVGPIRFDLTTVGPATEVIVSVDRRSCEEIFG